MRPGDVPPERVGIEALVGREREIEVLRALLAESASAPIARSAVITGPAGIGKTRLAEEITRIAGALGATVWWGHGDPNGRPLPFGTLSDVLHRLAEVGPHEPLSERRRKLRDRVGRHVDVEALWETAAVLGEAMGTSFFDAGTDDGPQAPAGSVLLADLAMRAWEELLAAELAAGPIVLVLDDAHSADLPSMRLFDAALRNLSNRPFAVVALGRASLVTTFPALFVGHPDASLVLEELTEAHARALLGALASHGIAPSAVAEAAAGAGGNPFVLEEVARTLTPLPLGSFQLARPEAPSSATGATPLVETPKTAAGVAAARIEASSPEARWVLRAASVLGEVFARADLEAMLEGALDAAALDPAIEEACARGLLERRAGALAHPRTIAGTAAPAGTGATAGTAAPAGTGATTGAAAPAGTGATAGASALTGTGATAGGGDDGYGDDLAFRSALVREVAYGTLSEEDRARAHRLAAHRLAAEDRDPAVLAWHFEHGGAPEQAVERYRVAALRALAANDFEAAIARGKRAEACGAQGKTLGEVARILADAHLWRGETEPAEREARRAVQLLDPGTVAWFQASTAFAIAASRMGNTGALHAAARDLEALLAARPSSSIPPALRVAQVTSMSRLAIALVFSGDVPAAEPLLGRMHTLRVAGALDALPYALGQAHRAHAIRAHVRDELLAAFLAFDAAAASFERAGALRDACVDHANSGFMKTELGQNEDAEQLQSAALAAAKRLGLPTVTANAQLNLCLLLTRRGAAFPAVAMGETALGTFEKQGSARMITIANVYLARALLVGGALGPAQKRAKRATDFGDDVLPYKAYAFGALAATELALGRVPEAVTAAETAMATLREHGAEEGAAFVRLAYVEALDAADRVAEARDALYEADSALAARAAKIADPGHREAFVRNIPEHAHTVERADDLGVGHSSRAPTMIARG